VVKAVCWTGSNWNDLCDFVDGAVLTSSGVMIPIDGEFKVVNTGDHIVRTDTRIEVVDKDFFLEHYIPV
jgi:hypothetical protein